MIVSLPLNVVVCERKISLSSILGISMRVAYFALPTLALALLGSSTSVSLQSLHETSIVSVSIARSAFFIIMRVVCFLA